jgi:hypothetical protein
MAGENPNANTTPLTAAQLETSTPESRPEHGNPTKDSTNSKPNNPFDHPDGKQVQNPYDHTTEKLILEEFEVGTTDKSGIASDERGTLSKRLVVFGCSCLPLIVLLGIAAAVVVLVIALGAGLGVGLKKYVSDQITIHVSEF